jgi:RES domain-containing protein
LVHAEIDIEDLPATLRYLEIDAPDSVRAEEVDIPNLEPHWKEDLAITRRIGDDWLRDAQSGLLRVPSVIVPETWNVLLNPRHPDAGRVRILRLYTHPIDPRLLA